MKKAAAASMKKKAATPLAEPTVDPSEDIYLIVFYAGASLDMPGNPT